MKKLKGSEKQIKWARDININFMTSVENLKKVIKSEDYKNWLMRRYDVEEEKGLMEEIKKLDEKEESTFWINNRETIKEIERKIENGIKLEGDNMAFIRGVVIEVEEIMKGMEE